ncbi:MAG: twin-arginine translocase TatA/TatE family subunit [Rubripirellula sp.]
MFGLSPFELVVIGIIAVVLFGGNLPDVARKMGGSYREFRRSLSEVQSQFKAAEFEAKKSLNLDEPLTSQPEDDDEELDEPSAPKFKPPT